MSLIKLENNWYRYGEGLQWRIAGPHYFCETGREGNIPLFTDAGVISRVRRVKSFYQSNYRPGKIDQYGYGIDILVANSFAESGGNVPTSVSTSQLLEKYNSAPGNDPGTKLNYVIDFLLTGNTKSLVRKEPGFSTPIASPDKISLGAHHSLISTALWLKGKKPPDSTSDIIELVTRLPAESKFAAEIAEMYFTNSFSRHQLQPPLMAACYNAGSIRPSAKNHWNLASYGDHIDRWIQFFNTSRSLSAQSITKPAQGISTSGNVSAIIPPVTASASSGETFSVERIVACMKRKNFVLNEEDSQPYNLNLVGLRNPGGKLNVFDDKMAVLWKYNGAWNMKLYTITTEPGATYINSADLGGKLCNPLGTAILVPGQYPNSHHIGIHKTYEALTQYGKIKVYRDANMNNKLDYDPATIHTAGPDAGVNIHHAGATGTTIHVGPWSAGCQVFASITEFNEFMDLCRKRSQSFGKIFTYTLMLWSDL
jgi:hypothetical protein